jgi:membrane protein implicated in regulation of membrane protease activity
MVTSPAALDRAAAPAHPRDLVLWHGLSAVCMAVMLVGVVPTWLAGGAVVAFAVGLPWCVLQAVRHQHSAAYLRVSVCSAAMVAMLVPGGLGDTSMSVAMTGAMTAHPDRGPLVVLLTLALLTVALACVATAITSVTLVGRRDRPSLRDGRRAAAGLGEAVLATAMAAMLTGLL